MKFTHFKLLFLIAFVVLANTENQQQSDSTQQSDTQDIPVPEKPKIFPLVLTPTTIDLAIQQKPLLLIEFYASWCAPCRQFAPEYQALTEKAIEHNIECGAYDSQKDQDRYATEKFQISSFPTFIFFVEGRQFIFTGQRSTENLLQWMLQILNGPNPTEILSDQQFNEFLQDNDVVLFYQGSENNVQDPNYWTFYEMSKSTPDAAFAYSYLQQIGKPGKLYYYSKGLSERKSFTQAFTKININRFILQNQLPDVPILNEQSGKLVYSGVQPSFILFTSLDDISNKAEKAFLETAQLFKKTYQFSYTKITDEKFFEELNKLGGDDGVFPKIIAWNNGNKYKFNGPDFSVKGIKNFIFDFRQGKLDKFIKSEPLPTQQQNSYVKKLVSHNFVDEVLKAKTDVLVEYYADWCGACKQFKPTYDQLAYELRDNSNIVIAQINAPDNEIPDSYQPHSYPDIVLYRASDKPKKPIQWQSENRTVESIIEFIQANQKLEV